MNNIMDQKAYYAILFEYYKDLLTEKQANAFVYYYNEDYSLAEIASEENISRNAVWDTLKKATSLLEHYEEKLGLYKKDLKLIEKLETLEKHTDDEGKNIIKEIREME